MCILYINEYNFISDETCVLKSTMLRRSLSERASKLMGLCLSFLLFLKQVFRDQGRAAGGRRISENSFSSEDLDFTSGERSHNVSGGQRSMLHGSLCYDGFPPNGTVHRLSIILAKWKRDHLQNLGCPRTALRISSAAILHGLRGGKACQDFFCGGPRFAELPPF